MIHDMKIYLQNNHELIIKILNYFKYKDITKHKDEFRCAKPYGDNSSTVRIKLNEYLTSNDFSIAFKGDLFGLISNHSGLTYGEILSIVKLIINKKIESVEVENTLFDGFFDNYHTEYKCDVTTHSNDILNNYEVCWNERFLLDNILPSTQHKFKIGYCYESDRITIPWLDTEGNLIGIMGRINNDEYTRFKYIPLIKFPKHRYLYGLFQNKEHIRDNRLYILESEKSVMQLDSMGIYNAVALGGNSIHVKQVEELLKLNVKEFILCFDEGLDKEVIKLAINTIRECLFMRDDVKIGIMLDKNNDVMIKNSKCSPTDLGLTSWNELVKNHITIGR